MKKDKLFCDFDGTLLDVSERHYKVYTDIMPIYNGHALSQAEYWNLKRKKMRWPDLLPLSGIPATKLGPFLNDFKERIESEEYLKIDKLIPGAEAALTALAGRYVMHLVTLRRNKKNLMAQLDWLGIRAYFEGGVLSEHSETDGFDVKIALMQQKLGTDRGTIIGDTEADIIAGKELGLETIAVSSGIRDEQFLIALKPDHLVRSIADAPALLLAA